MPLREAIAFLKGAVARSSQGDAHYAFHDGVMFAQSSAILAAYPVPHMLGTFGLAADDLESAVDRMAEEPAIEAGDGTIVLRSGKRRSSIDLFAAEPPGHALDDVAWLEPSAGMIRGLKTVLPFASKEGKWQRGVELRPGLVRALSSTSACLAEVEGLEVDAPTAMTDDAVKFITSLPVEPSGWTRLPGALAFTWPSGAWMRCQLSAYDWPHKLVDPIFSTSPEGDPVEVTDEWREEFSDVKRVGEGTVDLSPSGMVGRSPHAVHHADFATGVVHTTRWTLAALAPVLEVADLWHPDTPHGKGAVFRGPGVSGVVIAIQGAKRG